METSDLFHHFCRFVWEMSIPLVPLVFGLSSLPNEFFVGYDLNLQRSEKYLVKKAVENSRAGFGDERKRE